jgi:site-specific DNA-methyltransferase (adenine-specific)
LIWQFSPHAETGKIPHPAPFPVAIPLRCLMLAGAQSGDVVLDPYLGSGTTAVAATTLGLDYVGYEINESYVALANQRIVAAQCLWGSKLERTG